MNWSRRKSVPSCLALLLLLLGGCVFSRTASLQTSPTSPASSTPPVLPRPREERALVPTTAAQPPQDHVIMPVVLHTTQQIEASSELSVDSLVEEVLSRNPSLAQMTAAWQAASARYPQVRSLEDPMFSGMIAPASFGSQAVEGGYRVEVSQKIPFPGKLRLRGQGALAEASAAGNDVEDMRVQLIEMARLAFYEYFLAIRASAVNEESLKLLNQFRENAEVRYKNGQVPQQDILQADVEIGRQRERGLTLERTRKVAIARINTLRNMLPNETLPPPPREIMIVPGLLPTAEHLQSLALAQRPDLKAMEDRIAVEQNTLALALRDYYPDTEVSAAYDSIMGNGPARDLAPQIGVRLNIPLRHGRRDGAVTEAQAKIAQKRAELASRVNQVRFQVHDAYEQLLESERILALYDKTILPAAQENVKAAQSAYVTGKVPFLSLIEAQRTLVNLRDRYYEATTDYFRRSANLERAIGNQVSARKHLPAEGKQ